MAEAPAVTSDPAADARLVAEELGKGQQWRPYTDGTAAWQIGDALLGVIRLPPEHAAALVAALRTKRQQRDDPELDATDGAHPAWWRGNDAGVAGACRVLAAVLDGSDGGSGVVGFEPLEMLRGRLREQREELERLRARVAELEHLDSLVPELREFVALYAKLHVERYNPPGADPVRVPVSALEMLRKLGLDLPPAAVAALAERTEATDA
jgi:hypothetical protein